MQDKFQSCQIHAQTIVSLLTIELRNMAALVVQSRFAGLKIEDDDYPPTGDVQKSKKVKAPSAAKKPAEPPKKNKSATKTQAAPKKKKPKQNAATSEQWETWKQKDEELVDGNFESELQQAILLSKLDYEEKKDVYKQTKKEAENEKKLSEQNSRTTTKKQKKKNVMSLDQFNDMVNSGEEKVNFEDAIDTFEVEKAAEKDTEFFERIKDDTKQELLKDKIIDKVRHRLAVSDEVITRVQFIDALERKDKEILALREEVSSIKKELLTVKSRNKKLCNILGQGEMKDKAEVLMEVENLRTMQSELNAELAALHTELEKERSKNAQDPRTKDKKKKGGNDKEKL
ncbi:G kinase-anchoring protein 1-like isoform X2 [Ostrinia furnacalis]|uniref:G kinase-anchoring protein 1-like isoform X2 n=1 Tax=Ostrinia furnacalis TaxID=93504 RepID=UPI001039D8FE|nr:G kinase-anchoring protein 1-like isoform X2 [Ostrinia furnacalis]